MGEGDYRGQLDGGATTRERATRRVRAIRRVRATRLGEGY